jgi:hypothetical protein
LGWACPWLACPCPAPDGKPWRRRHGWAINTYAGGYTSLDSWGLMI